MDSAQGHGQGARATLSLGLRSLADDIQNYLHRVPLIAGPPTTLYRIQKFVRRNQVIVAAATVVAIVLVLGSLVSTWEAIRATQAQREQGRLRQQAEAQAYAADMSLAQQALAAGQPRPGPWICSTVIGRGPGAGPAWMGVAISLAILPERRRVSPSASSRSWCVLSPFPRMGNGLACMDSMGWRGCGISRPEGRSPPFRSLAREFGSLAFSPRGDLLAVTADGGIVRLWDVTTQTDRARLQCPEYAKPLEFSADGTRLATLAPMKENSEWEVALWDVATARLISKFTAKGQIELWQGRNTLSWGSGFVAIGWCDGRIGLWQAETGKELLPRMALP